MIPIQDLLSRIQWDPACRESSFEVGYLDRVAGGIVRVPFSRLELAGGVRPALAHTGVDGVVCHIPFHRVRQVWQDGRLIWARGPGAVVDSV